MSRPTVIAIGPRGLGVRHPSGGSGTYFALSRIEPDDSLDWAAEALLIAREALELGAGDIVDWLILRPLALGKVIGLPPVRAGTLRSLATANTSRFFPVSSVQWAADALPLERSRNQPRRTLVTALPEHVLAIVEEATRSADLRVGRIVPAPAAAAFEARRLLSLKGCPATCQLELCLPGHTEVVRLEDGMVTGLIPLADDEEPDSRDVLGDEIPACSVLGREWPLALRVARTASIQRNITQPLTAPQLASRHRATRLRSVALAVVVCLAILTGFGFQILGEQRELTSLRAVRSAFASDVEQALRQRNLLQVLGASVRDLSAAEVRQSNWPQLFHDLTASLPSSAHVTQVSGRPDSLTLTLTIDDVSTLEAFRSASSFDVVMQEATRGPAVRVLTAWRHGEAQGGANGD